MLPPQAPLEVFVASALSRSRGTERIIVGQLDGPVANQISNALVVNAVGLSVELEEGFVRHIINRHGSEKERLMGQLPISKEDFLQLPKILEQGKMTALETKKGGSQLIVVVAFTDFTYRLAIEFRRITSAKRLLGRKSYFSINSLTKKQAP